MSPSLLLDKEKEILPPHTEKQIKTAVDAKDIGKVDAKTGIRFHCRCTNKSGCHEVNCIYNLV